MNLTTRTALFALLACATMAGTLPAGAKLLPSQLRTEYLVEPSTIETLAPRLTWILESTGRGQRQTAYRILVASSEKSLKHDMGD